MAIGEREPQGGEKEASRQQERANRILDAAATLILRWGYNKTTVDDIARQAGVAKGTIYLHWKSREDLFAALLQRERVQFGEEYSRLVEADPEGGTLRGIYRNSALALAKRPLLKALLLRDTEMLGKLAHGVHATAAYAERIEGFRTYLKFMRERGLVRTDLSLEAEVYAISAIMTGYLTVGSLLPPELSVSEEVVAGLIGETIHRTLEANRPVSAEELRAASEAVTPYLQRIQAEEQGQLEDKMKPAAEKDQSHSER